MSLPGSRSKESSGGETMKYAREHATHRLTYYERLLREQPEALAGREEERLRRTIDEYGDFVYRSTLDPKRNPTLAEVARLDLRRLHQLANGLPAKTELDRTIDGLIQTCEAERRSPWRLATAR